MSENAKNPEEAKDDLKNLTLQSIEAEIARAREKGSFADLGEAIRRAQEAAEKAGTEEKN